MQLTTEQLFEATASNTSFSKKLAGLQLAVDSTSLGEFKTCPRKYLLGIILGYQSRGENVHLTFGLLVHGGIERFHHAKAQGQDHDSALSFALDWVLKETWDRVLGRPWSSGDSNKNRLTLVRTLVWYLDQYGEDALVTSIRSDGKPAVELSFSFDSGHTSRATGEPILFCGHLDRLATMNGVPYIPDCKTTKHQLDPRYWAQFNPSNQFGMYDLAGAVALGQPSKGIIVDGMQILVNSTKFARFLISKDEATREEWLEGAGWWLAGMESCAERRSWPMNDKACSMYGGCQFQEICSRSPNARQQWLDAKFARRTWDPLQRRGDI